MKTKEELNQLKEEVEALGNKLTELTGDELKQVVSGSTDYEKDVQRYLDGLINPPERYHDFEPKKKPNPLPY